MENGTLTFRAATEQDINKIALLARIIWPEAYKEVIPESQIDFMLRELYSAPALEKQMQQGQKFIIAEIDKQPAGFISYSDTDQPQIGKINKVYLSPAHHGKGAGKNMMDYAEKAISAEGKKAVILNVNRNNKAVNFYLRCGYRIYEEVDIPIGPFWMNDFIMRKELL